MRKTMTLTGKQIGLLVMLCWVSIVQAVEPLKVGPGALKGVNVAPYLQYRLQFAESEDIRNVLASDPSQWWPVEAETANFGLNNQAHWFRLELHSENPRRVYLELSYALLNQVDVFLVQRGQVERHWLTGNNQPFSSREVEHRNYIFPLFLPAGTSSQVFLRIQTQGSLQVPLALWDPDRFWEADQLAITAHSFFAAAMLTVALLNFLLFLGIKDRLFFYYASYVLTIALAQLALRGMNYQFLWPNAPAWNEHSLVLFMGLAVASGGLFANRYLRVRERSRYLYRGSLLMIVPGAVMGGAALFLPYGILIGPMIVLCVLASILMLVTGLSFWGQGHKSGRFFTLAWAFFLVGILGTLLAKLGLLPRSNLLEYGPEFGAAVEVILLSFGITDRLNEERRLRIALQETALASAEEAGRLQAENLAREHQANVVLEENVAQRTQELQKALLELSVAHAKLQDISTLDGLTQLRNRRYFDESFRREWERATREANQLSVIMLDADHFKQINDSHGHLAGDDCLKQLARVLEGHVKRPADTLARFGGEEFVMVLPGTDPHGVLRLAENIRLDVEAHPVNHDGQVIPLTVSVGVAYCGDVRSFKSEDLLALADKALYEAKASGRNRVVVRELI